MLFTVGRLTGVIHPGLSADICNEASINLLNPSKEGAATVTATVRSPDQPARLVDLAPVLGALPQGVACDIAREAHAAAERGDLSFSLPKPMWPLKAAIGAGWTGHVEISTDDVIHYQLDTHFDERKPQ